MARPKIKDTSPISFRIDKSLNERLNKFCSESGQSKTVAVERALEAYIDNYNKKMELLESASNK